MSRISFVFVEHILYISQSFFCRSARQVPGLWYLDSSSISFVLPHVCWSDESVSYPCILEFHKTMCNGDCREVNCMFFFHPSGFDYLHDNGFHVCFSAFGFESMQYCFVICRYVSRPSLCNVVEFGSFSYCVLFIALILVSMQAIFSSIFISIFFLSLRAFCLPFCPVLAFHC